MHLINPENLPFTGRSTVQFLGYAQGSHIHIVRTGAMNCGGKNAIAYGNDTHSDRLQQNRWEQWMQAGGEFIVVTADGEYIAYIDRVTDGKARCFFTHPKFKSRPFWFPLDRIKTLYGVFHVSKPQKRLSPARRKHNEKERRRIAYLSSLR